MNNSFQLNKGGPHKPYNTIDELSEEEQEIVLLRVMNDTLKKQVTAEKELNLAYRQLFKFTSALEWLLMTIKIHSIWLGVTLLVVLLYIDFERWARIIKLIGDLCLKS